MVLTEAFAAGTPVIASDIAGYRDVVRNGVDGILVPPADPQALAESLRDLWDEPERRVEMSRAAAADVRRFAWPHVAAEVMSAYEDAIASPKPVGSAARVAVAVGVNAADLQAARARAPAAEPRAQAGRQAPARGDRRAAHRVRGDARSACCCLVWKALAKIGIANILSALAPPRARRS